MLTGLNQKVSGQVQGHGGSPAADNAPPAERHDLNPGAIEKVNEVTPLSPREGRLTVRKADEAAEKGGGRKPMPLRSGADRG
jgi:hypothetical protein